MTRSRSPHSHLHQHAEFSGSTGISAHSPTYPDNNPHTHIQTHAVQCAHGYSHPLARKRVLVFVVVTAVLIILATFSATIGQFHMSLGTLARAFAAQFAIVTPPSDPLAMPTLWGIRLPRIALGILVGAALAVAGAILQAIFSNPLAEPGVIGISAGASVGASIAIVFAPMAMAGFSVPLAAFLTALLAAFAVWKLSATNGRTETITLVLSGIALTAVSSALASIATYLAPATARDQVVFWQMGSLAGATWAQVGVVGTVLLFAMVWAMTIARQLDVLALGERAAGHVGINVQALRRSVVTLAALLTAAAVAYAGVIAFVGLIIPHLIRLLIGPNNAYLIPASFLAGATLITGADVLARNLIPYADLPIGIFTALVGGPVFFVLMRKTLKH